MLWTISTSSLFLLKNSGESKSCSSAIANQESLSALETEMRKLEGLVKEVVDEMGYLKTREQKFTDTNCAFQRFLIRPYISITPPFFT
jgi:emp24/gp25L/p24 family/GOLD